MLVFHEENIFMCCKKQGTRKGSFSYQMSTMKNSSTGQKEGWLACFQRQHADMLRNSLKICLLSTAISKHRGLTWRAGSCWVFLERNHLSMLPSLNLEEILLPSYGSVTRMSPVLATRCIIVTHARNGEIYEKLKKKNLMHIQTS